MQVDTFAILRDLGYYPIAPLLSHYIDERHPAGYERWMEWCLAMVGACDVVLRLPGESAGADREVSEAQRLGKLVVYSIDELQNVGALTVGDLLKNVVDVPGMSYTWPEFKAANQQALDDIAAALGVER